MKRVNLMDDVVYLEYIKLRVLGKYVRGLFNMLNDDKQG